MDGLVKGYLVGSFDLFNVGHLALIREATSLCDSLLVGVLADAFVEAETGAPPYIPLTERLQIVRSVRGVAEAFDAPSRLAAAHAAHGFSVVFLARPSLVAQEVAPAALDLGIRIVQLQSRRYTESELVRLALSAHSAAA